MIKYLIGLFDYASPDVYCQSPYMQSTPRLLILF